MEENSLHLFIEGNSQLPILLGSLVSPAPPVLQNQCCPTPVAVAAFRKLHCAFQSMSPPFTAPAWLISAHSPSVGMDCFFKRAAWCAA